MTENTLNSKAFLKALDDFDAHQKAPKAMGVAPIPITNVCATYVAVKPILEGILPFLGWLPGVGARIVVAIRALMAGLDIVCPRP
jgi:hypothetical protein